MKKSVLSLGIATIIGLVGCSSSKPVTVSPGVNVPAGPQQAISEQRLENDFKRQGVKVFYTVFGELDAIEVTGYAPVWGNSQSAAREAFRVAELEAKKALNDFMNKEIIASSTSVEMISKNLEKARDNKLNNFSSNRGRDTVASMATDEEVANTDKNSQTNTASRQDALTIASVVKNNISIRNQGILGGLYLVEGDVINDGRNVRAVYRWDRKSNAIRPQLRGLMNM